MNRRTIGLLVALLSAPATSRAQLASISGVAFIDANRNGVRDANERALANVVVSNQNTVVKTDASGAYHFPRGASGVVFVSTPDGYHSVGTFWRHVDDTTSTINFPLGDTRANGVTVPLAAGATWMVYKSSAGKTTHLILDVTGYFK